MRVIFMGTDSFAVPSLKAVIESGVELVHVITQPDQPKGRGLKLSPSPIKEHALKYGIPVYQPERIKDRLSIERFEKEFKPDLIIVVAFGQILPKAIIDLPKYGCINIHPSLLPKYRGAAPIQRAIINGENETAVTMMFMDEGEDTGDIIYQEHINIDISDTALSLSEKLSLIASDMLLKILKNADGTPVNELALPHFPQDNNQATHAPRLTREDGLINWGKKNIEIHNLIRGTIPWPVSYTNTHDGLSIKVWESRLPSDLEKAKEMANPGIIAGITKDSGILVTTGNGFLVINTVQPPNKQKMKARDFINGYRLKIGDMFR